MRATTQPLMPATAPEMESVHAEAFAPAQAWDAATFRAMLERETGLGEGVFSQDGQLSAFALVQFVAGEAEILTLATRPTVRRQGYATKLLQALEDRLRGEGLNKWLLDVAADNPGAIAFYRRQGFLIDGRRANYYRRANAQRVDAVLMSKAMGGQTAV